MRLIDADELIEHAYRDKLDSRELIATMINNAPTVKEIPMNVPLSLVIKALENEPKTGHWIETGNKGHIDVDNTILYQEMCNQCKRLSYFRKSCGKLIGAEYCPNCMAKMESEEQE